MVQFYEQFGKSIFPSRLFGDAQRLFTAKYKPAALKSALESVFGAKLLGDSSVRLLIPSVAAHSGSLHIWKTAHGKRFLLDYQAKAVDVALSTSAAPTYLPEHTTDREIVLVDGGLWANNPMGMAVVEAIGVLGWPREDIYLLSLGCTTAPVRQLPRWAWQRGLVYSKRLLEVVATAQSFGAEGTAALLIGHDHIHRYNPVVSAGRFRIDGTRRTRELKGLGVSEARVAIPKLKDLFFVTQAEEFAPFYRV